MQFTIFQKTLAEFTGTLFLLMIVVGSGIMGENLAQGNVAIALLANTLATGAGLVVIISLFGPISGAHFNPIVTMIMKLRNELSLKAASLYIMAQVLGAILGVWLTHLMFGQEILQISQKSRDGFALFSAEIIASFGLLLTILLGVKFKPDAVPKFVGLYIISAYWFTASTSFANPAVSIARSLSNSFAGINPYSAPAFILAQIIGALMAYGFVKILLADK